MNKITLYFIIAFFVIASAPFWGVVITRIMKTENTENRILAKFPSIAENNTAEYISKLDIYIQDRHGFRDQFSTGYINFYMNILKESPLPNSVVIGDNGWYFLGDNYDKTHSRSIGVSHVDDKQIENVCEEIRQIKLLCDSLDIKFYFAIAPNKESVYPEYLIPKSNNHPKLKDRIIHILKTKQIIEPVDLGISIYPIKDSIQLFRKNDSHWNNLGALYAVKDLTSCMKQDLIIDGIDFNNFDISPSKSQAQGGDLTAILKVEAPDVNFDIQYKGGEDIAVKNTQDSNFKSWDVNHYINRNANNTTKGIVYRDSFFGAMNKPFSTCIKEYISIGHFAVNRTDIARSIDALGQKPDFLLLEIVERNLMYIKFDTE